MLPKPSDGYLDRPKADAVLTRFVFGTRKDGPVLLPKRAEPAQVDEFLAKALQADSPTSRQVSKAGDLMRFFDLRGRAEQVARLLNQRERERDEVLRSIAAIAIVGDLGPPPAQQKAGDYYRQLAARDLAEPFYEQLVDLFFYLPEPADPKWITDPIDRKRAKLEPDVPNNVDAEVAYKKLGHLKENRLNRILKAKQRRHQILAGRDAARRRHDLARCYLRLEQHAHADLRGWAAMVCQRECNEGKPADLAEAFSHMLDLLMAPASVPGPAGQRLAPEDEKVCIISCARAVGFYEGTLTQPQAEFADAHRNVNQSDILYWGPE